MQLILRYMEKYFDFTPIFLINSVWHIASKLGAKTLKGVSLQALRFLSSNRRQDYLIRHPSKRLAFILLSDKNDKHQSGSFSPSPRSRRSEYQKYSSLLRLARRKNPSPSFLPFQSESSITHFQGHSPMLHPAWTNHLYIRCHQPVQMGGVCVLIKANIRLPVP